MKVFLLYKIVKKMPSVKKLVFCTKCKRSFTRKAHLDEHTHKVHNVNPFVYIYRCRECGNDYKYKKNCLFHVRKHHELLPKNRPLKKKVVNPGNAKRKFILKFIEVLMLVNSFLNLALSGCFVKLSILHQVNNDHSEKQASQVTLQRFDEIELDHETGKTDTISLLSERIYH